MVVLLGPGCLCKVKLGENTPDGFRSKRVQNGGVFLSGMFVKIACQRNTGQIINRPMIK